MVVWRRRGALALVLVLAVTLAGCASLAASFGSVGRTPSGVQRPGTTPIVVSASAPPLPGPAAPPGSRYALMNSVTVGAAPASVAYDSGKGETFVVNSNSGNVSVISDATTQVVASIAVGSFPYGATYDSGRNEVFVANTGSDSVSVISDATNQVVATVSLSAGDWPSGLVYDSGIGAVFVANSGSDSIAEISDATNAVNNTLSTGVGSVPFGLAYDSGRGQIFVSLRGAAHVAVIVDTSLAMATIPVGQTPTGVAYDAARGEIYVANNGSNTVSVIADGNESIVTNIPVGSNPFGIAYGAGTGEVAVTYVQSYPPNTFGTLGLIADGNHTLVEPVGLYGGGRPVSVAYDTARKGWFVADVALDTVMVVARGYAVTFTEIGLPAGTPWFLWFNGSNAFGAVRTEYASTVSTAVVVAANGTYAFAVPRSHGFTPSPASGPVTVAGAAESRMVTFSFLYTVTFTETGLPAGTNWSVTLAGTLLSSTGTSIVSSEANGSYAFSVGTVSGYVASPGSGNLAVNGTAANQAISFAPPSSGTDTALLLAVAAVAAVVVIAVAVILMRRRRKVPPQPGTPPTEPGVPPS